MPHSDPNLNPERQKDKIVIQFTVLILYKLNFNIEASIEASTEASKKSNQKKQLYMQNYRIYSTT